MQTFEEWHTAFAARHGDAEDLPSVKAALRQAWDAGVASHNPWDTVGWTRNGGLNRHHRQTDTTWIATQSIVHGMCFMHIRPGITGETLVLYREAGWWHWESRLGGRETLRGQSHDEAAAMTAALGARP